MKKALVFLFALVAATMAMASGSQQGTSPTGQDKKGSEPVVIRWAYWGSGVRIEISQKAIDLFQARNPGVKINPEVSGGTGDHFNKVDTQLAGGSGPDIIQMGGNINDYVKRGVLLPLDPYVGKILDTASIDPTAIESGTFNGKLYGISTGVNMPALVYNKSLIQRIGVPLPKTTMSFKEFREYLVTLKSKLPAGIYPMMDIGSMASNSTFFGYWLSYKQRPLYIAETNSTAVTADLAKEYLDFFKDLRDNGLVPPPDVAASFAESNADTSAIIAGKVVIGFLWSNQLGGYQAATKDELDLMEPPGAAETKALWQQPSQFYTVNLASRNPEWAVRFINFLVNDPDAARILGSNRGFPASSKARAAGFTDINDQKVIKYMSIAAAHSSKQKPNLPNDTEFNSTLYLIYQKVAFNQINTAEGGKQIYDLIIRLINK